MERTVVERNNLLTSLSVALALAILMLAVTTLLLIDLNTYITVSLFFIVPMAIILLIGAYFIARPGNREMIIIDNDGLTINGNISLGPIPWDCIYGAKVNRILFEKQLVIDITNIPKMEKIFGTETIHKKIRKKRKADERVIIVDISPCKLRGIDLEALIRECATGQANRKSYQQPRT
jgi:hypothetical protein